MGRKTNPNILRIGNILHNWDAKWFSDSPKNFRDNLIQDIKIRNYIKKQMRTASISRIEIVRQARETVLTIHTSRPAVVIGRGGSGIEKIQKDLQKMFGKTVRFRINVQEIRNPDTDASAVATQVVDQLERRMPYRRVLKQVVSRSMQAGARGIRISIAGRLNGADIARREWLAEGSVPLHTFRSDVSYAQRTAFTTFGAIGIKVWINRGEYELDNEEKPGEAIGTPKETRPRPRRRTSLAEKVTK